MSNHYDNLRGLPDDTDIPPTQRTPIAGPHGKLPRAPRYHLPNIDDLPPPSEDIAENEPDKQRLRERLPVILATNAQRLLAVTALTSLIFAGSKYYEVQKIEEEVAVPTLTIYKGQALLDVALTHGGVGYTNSTGQYSETTLEDLLKVDNGKDIITIKIPSDLTSPEEGQTAEELNESLAKITEAGEIADQTKDAGTIALISLGGILVTSQFLSRQRRKELRENGRPYHDPYNTPVAGMLLGTIFAGLCGYSTIGLMDESNLRERVEEIAKADYNNISSQAESLRVSLMELGISTKINQYGQLEIELNNNPEQIASTIEQSDQLIDSLPTLAGIDNSTGDPELDQSAQVAQDMFTGFMAFGTLAGVGIAIGSHRARKDKRYIRERVNAQQQNED